MIRFKKVTLDTIITPMPAMSERVRIMQATETFRDYVRSFYGPGGIYDMGANAGHIADATVIYLEQCKAEAAAWGNGDSTDREKVRDIMIENFGLKFPGEAA